MKIKRNKISPAEAAAICLLTCTPDAERLAVAERIFANKCLSEAAKIKINKLLYERR